MSSIAEFLEEIKQLAMELDAPHLPTLAKLVTIRDELLAAVTPPAPTNLVVRKDPAKKIVWATWDHIDGLTWELFQDGKFVETSSDNQAKAPLLEGEHVIGVVAIKNAARRSLPATIRYEQAPPVVTPPPVKDPWYPDWAVREITTRLKDGDVLTPAMLDYNRYVLAAKGARIRLAQPDITPKAGSWLRCEDPGVKATLIVPAVGNSQAVFRLRPGTSDRFRIDGFNIVADGHEISERRFPRIYAFIDTGAKETIVTNLHIGDSLTRFMTFEGETGGSTWMHAYITTDLLQKRSTSSNPTDAYGYWISRSASGRAYKVKIKSAMFGVRCHNSIALRFEECEFDTFSDISDPKRNIAIRSGLSTELIRCKGWGGAFELGDDDKNETDPYHIIRVEGGEYHYCFLRQLVRSPIDPKLDPNDKRQGGRIEIEGTLFRGNTNNARFCFDAKNRPRGRVAGVKVYQQFFDGRFIANSHEMELADNYVNDVNIN